MRYDFQFETVSVYACAVQLIAQHAPQEGLHLDLGCGEGAISESIQAMGMTYVGLDTSADSVSRLKGRGYEAHVIDFSNAEQALEHIQALCAGRPLASVSMLDVIEHLPMGSAFLRLLRDWVASIDAAVPLIVSVPNFSHFDVATKLLAGKWDYTQTGLLDNTHQVIYTRGLLDSTLLSAGWRQVGQNDYLLEHSDQFHLEPTVLLNREAGIGRHLRSIKELVDPDAGVHQFVRAYLSAAVIEEQADAKPPRLLSIVVHCGNDAEHPQRILAQLAQQTDQDIDILLVDCPASVAELVCQYPQYANQLYIQAGSALTSDSWSGLAGSYWTVLYANQMLPTSYVQTVRRVIERQTDQVIVFMDPKVAQEATLESHGHFCMAAPHFDVIAADSGPWYLIPMAYNRQFDDSPDDLTDAQQWRTWLLRAAVRAGLWHDFDNALDWPAEAASVQLLAGIPGYQDLIHRAVKEAWPRANELADLMAAPLVVEPESTAVTDPVEVIQPSPLIEDPAAQQFEQALLRAEAAERELSLMQSTFSWKVTAPLRMLNHMRHGRVGLAGSMAYGFLKTLSRKLPFKGQLWARQALGKARRWRELAEFSPQNDHALADLVSYRCRETDNIVTRLSLINDLGELPAIDISVVSYNSKRWVESFSSSLLALDYPRDLLSVTFVDNSSTDGTELVLAQQAQLMNEAGLQTAVLIMPNNGFGAGHNAGIRDGRAPFCLVTNLDLEFEPDALRSIARLAATDDAQTAAWELRQKPYEHPKYYEPVSGLTNWNSHACVLLRRTAFEAVGGYDENLFMYAEDVELSYRLRREGFHLRYCPSAVVYHYTYEAAGEVKPLQYTGSTFGNFYLRLKYGRAYDIAVIPLLAMALLSTPSPYKGSRIQLLKKLGSLLMMMPKVLAARKRSSAAFPFRGFDFEMTRRGAFVEAAPLNTDPDNLVTIVTRTYRGRETYLKQAIISVINQTHPNIELVVVEDGGQTMQAVVDSFASAGHNVKFKGLEKVGRSAAGNAGLAMAMGRYCLFLDDDDLLFADHVEVLLYGLLADDEAVAAYSPAVELSTDAEELTGQYAELSFNTPFALIGNYSYEMLRVRNCMAIQSVLFVRRLFEERGGFEEDMDALEDWNLWCRYAAGNHFAFVDKATSLYRVPTDPAKIAVRQKALDDSYPLALERIVQIERDYLT